MTGNQEMQGRTLTDVIANFLNDYLNRLRYKWVSGTLVAMVIWTFPKWMTYIHSDHFLVYFYYYAICDWRSWIMSIGSRFVWVFGLSKFNGCFEKCTRKI